MSEKIPKGWKKYKFTDIAEIIGGGTPSKNNPDYWNGNIDWLTVSDFNTGKKYVRSAEQKITQLGLKKSSTKILKKGQIIISARGTVGIIAILAKDMAFNQSNYGINSKKETTFNDFLYYLLKYKLNELKQASYGAVFDTITKATFENLKIYLPPLFEQKAIASVLSSLDDKIDLLHRQNKTLEAMAETLFRQWFIEEAKEDWEEGVLGDVIEVFDSKRIPLSKMQRQKMKIGHLYPYYGAATIMDYINDYIFDGEYILMGEDGTVETSEGYSILQYAIGKFWVNNHAHVFRAKYPYNNFFIWIYLKNKNISEYITGAVQPKISQTNLKSIHFPKFPNYLVKKFQTVTNPIFDKIIQNKQQIRTLEKLRDTLLPKLMSGEVRVKL